jgi:hypothetical protein
VRVLIAVVFLVAALAPGEGTAGACDFKAGDTVRLTGAYVPGKPDYARSFVFAVQLECGSRDLVTVQRATGALPVCKPQERVEVVGQLVWNKFLMDGHYEINDPSSVTCLAAAEGAPPPAPSVSSPQETVQARAAATASSSTSTRGVGEQAPPRAPLPAAAPLTMATAPAAPVRTLGPSIWVGHYRDSRGEGDISFSLVRGTSTVSGTWKMRTGGGGPVTGLLDETGHRMQLRMENIAPECPGTFEGSAEINDKAMVVTYRGKDCQGVVSDGTLDLRRE